MKLLTNLSLCLTLMLILTACRDSSSDSNDNGSTPEREARPQPIDPGLVSNPSFEYREGTETLDRPWNFTQHATSDSYIYEAVDGVLTLARVGHEPWGQVFQRIQVADYAGQRVRFSAWLKAELDDSFEPGFEPSGLAVTVFGRSSSPMSGPTMLFSRDSAIPVELGEYGWARHDLEFDLPDNALRVEIRIRLTRGGWMKTQYPSLQAIEGATKQTPQVRDTRNDSIR